MENTRQKTVLVTGAAGFIGFHVSKRLLEEGWRVIGLDCMSDYYDISLKKRRESILLESDCYLAVHDHLEAPNLLMNLFEDEQPSVVIHLAAQAGVRHSIDNPRAYLQSNIIGTFELLEAARAYPPQHMLLASTSSAYGANECMPFQETARSDYQMSFYAATKKSTENMAHSYAHLFELPITMFRFFTVYGPWGRPDMALFKFTKAILNGDTIDVYNSGNMSRDFTYIDDLVHSIFLLMGSAPSKLSESVDEINNNQSPVAPYRVVNIGNAKPEKLTFFIESIEKATGLLATKNYLPMQAGDVRSTWADTSLLESIIGYTPNTDLETGVREFIEWYKDYYEC